jgi:putative solute:sodium symporter small subunit
MKKNRSYWTINVTVICVLLIIWFLISLGFGIMFSDAMDTYRLGGFKLGFWFAQQGSIIGFVIIIFLYAGIMNRVDKKFSKKDK